MGSPPDSCSLFQRVSMFHPPLAKGPAFVLPARVHAGRQKGIKGDLCLFNNGLPYKKGILTNITSLKNLLDFGLI